VPADIGLIIHGTTLATNAIIERKGARTALIVTQGFRDSIEMAYENRFEQYDIFMDKPAPLVPRDLRFGVPERLDAQGNVMQRTSASSLTVASGQTASSSSSLDSSRPGCSAR
jgi:N-methylhydantoinase A